MPSPRRRAQSVSAWPSWVMTRSRCGGGAVGRRGVYAPAGAGAYVSVAAGGVEGMEGMEERERERAVAQAVVWRASQVGSKGLCAWSWEKAVMMGRQAGMMKEKEKGGGVGMGVRREGG